MSGKKNRKTQLFKIFCEASGYGSLAFFCLKRNRIAIPKKILLLRFSSIGDIVLTTPVIRALQQRLGAEIHFLTKIAFASLLEPNPYVRRVYVFEKEVTEVLDELRRERYDLVVDLHHNLRSWRVKHALSVPARSFHKLNVEKWLLVNFKIDRLPDRHIVDRYLDTVSPLGVRNDGAGLDFFWPKNFRPIFLPDWQSKRRPFLALAIGAGYPTKTLTIHQLATICRSIPYPVLLLGGPSEVDKSEAILQQLDSATAGRVRSIVGQCTLAESAWWIQQSTVVLAGDTGLMHIAAALRKPLVTVWGNTVPAFGMTPYLPTGNEPASNFEVNGLACRPCSKIGHPACPKGHFRCMLDQSLTAIVAAVLERFEKVGNKK